MKVLIFPTCLVEKAGHSILTATQNILTSAGIEVFLIDKPTCCGQIAYNMGDMDNARKMADVWIDTYLKRDDYNYIVAPSGSCIYMIRKNLFKLYKNDPKKLTLLGKKVNIIFELIEFILKFNLMGKITPYFPHTVTYHPSCHYLRGLNIRKEPKELLRKVRGLQLIEMENEELCCGFGGLFSIKMNKISAALAQRKAEYIEKTGAEYVATPDLSCLLNIGGILSRNRSQVKPIHVSEILASGL